MSENLLKKWLKQSLDRLGSDDALVARIQFLLNEIDGDIPYATVSSIDMFTRFHAKNRMTLGRPLLGTTNENCIEAVYLRQNGFSLTIDFIAEDSTARSINAVARIANKPVLFSLECCAGEPGMKKLIGEIDFGDNVLVPLTENEDGSVSIGADRRRADSITVKVEGEVEYWLGGWPLNLKDGDVAWQFKDGLSVQQLAELHDVPRGLIEEMIRQVLLRQEKQR